MNSLRPALRNIVGLAGLLLAWACLGADPSAPAAPKAPASPVKAKAGQDKAKDAAPPYYKLFDDKTLPSFQEIEKKHRDLTALWTELDAQQQQLRTAEKAFGTKARKELGKEVPRLTREVQKRRESFDQRYQTIYRTYKDQYEKLKGEEMDLGDRLDVEKPDNPNSKKVQARIDEIIAETVRLDGYLEALSVMKRQIADHEKPFSEAALMSVDRERFEQIKTQYPDVVEGRRRVQDLIVDLDELKKAPAAGAKPVDPREVTAAQERLDAGIQALQAGIAKHLKPLQRESEALQKRIDRLQERIDSARKRDRNVDKETKERDGLTEELEKLTDRISLLEAVGKVALPAGK
ncbi:MAG: hypothetical protein BWZ02_02513 [Lentisphaerae bacterium ADurb.BinA184]|nr:MAG: hypothetical protein BWZ02_02513 [Lentisphaerae bacterium ADurb.BinA184]